MELLAEHGQMPSSAIAKKFRSTPSAVSQHLRILREARLVRMERKAQQRIYKLNAATITEMEDWLEHLRGEWDQRLNRLDRLLKEAKEASHGGR